jgi:hypothetical protein
MSQNVTQLNRTIVSHILSILLAKPTNLVCPIGIKLVRNHLIITLEVWLGKGARWGRMGAAMQCTVICTYIPRKSAPRAAVKSRVNLHLICTYM